MNLRQAEIILTILKAGSISGAAQMLYVTQSALSQSLKSIEKEINALIFQRGTNPIRLTYAGEKAAETAQKIVLLERNLQCEIEDINNERSGIFRFGLYAGISSNLLSTLVPQYVQMYPHVNLNIMEKGSTTIEQMLLDGSLDAGFLSGLPIHKELEYRLVIEDRIVLVAPRNSVFANNHPGEEPISFEQLGDNPFVAKRKGNRTRFILDQLSENYQLKTKIFFEIDDYSTAARIAQTCGCMMISPLSSYFNDPFLCENARYYSLQNFDTRHNTYLCYQKKLHLTAYMECWLEMVMAMFK